MKRQASVFVVATIVLFGTMVFADIAPTDFAASGITLADSNSVRMVSADVDIEWGMPCNLSAVFVLDNESGKDIDIKVGFPVETPDQPMKKETSDFKIAFNYAAVKDAEITRSVVSEEYSSKKVTWYQCKHTFVPGQTRVEVQAKMLPSLTKAWGGRERLFYYIQTGSSWKGRIGSEVVTIRFPKWFRQEQIIDASPAGYTIKDNRVQWQFADFEPASSKFDISIEYLHPEVFKTLSDIRAAHLNDPNNTKLTLKLAKHLFALGNYKGYSPYPPGRLNKGEYDAILSKVKDPEEQALIQSRYEINDEGVYTEKDSEWTPERNHVVGILNEIDYEPPYWKSVYVDEARALIERLLKEQPKNAEAWNVYLANYFRFRFAGIEPGSDEPIIYEHQKQVIMDAYSRCPKDPCIKFWYKRCTAKPKDPSKPAVYDPEGSPLVKQLKKAGVYELDYPKLEYEYY